MPILTLREYVLLAAVLVLGAALWWFGWHERGIGKAEYAAHDALMAEHQAEAVAKAVEAQAQKDKVASDELQAQIEQIRGDASLHPVSIIVCRRPASAGAVPSASGAPAKSGESAANGSGDQRLPVGDQPGTDVGPNVQLLADVARALAAQERETIKWSAQP